MVIGGDEDEENIDEGVSESSGANRKCQRDFQIRLLCRYTPWV
jgi:hypothetical protein